MFLRSQMCRVYGEKPGTALFGERLVPIKMPQDCADKHDRCVHRLNIKLLKVASLVHTYVIAREATQRTKLDHLGTTRLKTSR